MFRFILAVFVTVSCVNEVLSSQCTDDITKCKNAYNQAKTGTPDSQTNCDALILEYDCLRATEPNCQPADAQQITTLLNKEVLPILIEACPSELCAAEILGCTKQWKDNSTAAGSSLPLKCRDAAAFEACLYGIQQTCTDQQRSQIQQTVNNLRPQIDQLCKNEDCTVQTKTCSDSWAAAKSNVNGNVVLACVVNEGLQVCLERIESQCSPKERLDIQNLLGQIIPEISANCQGKGCGPKLIQCTYDWNTTVSATSDISSKCRADYAYESCLKKTESLCNPEEKAAMDSALSTIGPQLALHCSGESLKPLTITVLFLAILPILRRLL